LKSKIYAITPADEHVFSPRTNNRLRDYGAKNHYLFAEVKFSDLREHLARWICMAVKRCYRLMKTTVSTACAI